MNKEQALCILRDTIRETFKHKTKAQDNKIISRADFINENVNEWISANDIIIVLREMSQIGVLEIDKFYLGEEDI